MGLVEGFIQGAKGDNLVSVQLKSGEVEDFKKEIVVQVNPPKYEKFEDVSNLTSINDASVLYTLKTYSGLFCIANNPYKRNEVPLHLAITDVASMDVFQCKYLCNVRL